MADKKNKMKLKTRPIIIIAVIAVLLIGGITVYAMVKNSNKNKEPEVQVNLNQANLKPEGATAPVSKVVTTVEILLDNSAIPVGTTVQVAVLVTPEDTQNALVWSSSNTSVLTVDKDGVITITGTGNAVLTATIGTVSDAVAIEGISSATAGSVNNYPVYTGDSTYSKPSSDNASENDNYSGNDNTGSNNVGSDDTGSGNSSSNGGNNGGSDSGNNGGADSNGAGVKDSYGNGDSGSAGTSSGSNNTYYGTSEGATSMTIGGSLPSYGFNQTMSNVYVCEEDDVYYGEIVTQPNVTIVYIKQRSQNFDNRIISVLSQLLPNEYNQVWSNYLSASTDRTFTAEGRTVRIVAASGGGHSQIVIYN